MSLIISCLSKLFLADSGDKTFGSEASRGVAGKVTGTWIVKILSTLSVQSDTYCFGRSFTFDLAPTLECSVYFVDCVFVVLASYWNEA